MTSTLIIIWMYVVGSFSTYGFTKDEPVGRTTIILVLLFWPVTVPLATLIGFVARAWEIWRA